LFTGVNDPADKLFAGVVDTGDKFFHQQRSVLSAKLSPAAEVGHGRRYCHWNSLGCALTFASEAKFEIEAKISFRLEVKKKPDFT
jgi:hypothetical protein